VEYAGLLLLPGDIAGPAEHRPIIHLADGLVGEDTLSVTGRVLVAGLRHVRHLLGVVEGPAEAVRRWEGLDPADDARLFVSGHPVDALLVRQADRLICKAPEFLGFSRLRRKGRMDGFRPTYTIAALERYVRPIARAYYFHPSFISAHRINQAL
jgi:hypothetical protein